MGDGGLAIHVLADIGGTPDKLYQDTKIKALTKVWLERNQP